MAYQRQRVGVCEDSGELIICDIASGDVLARHVLAAGSGEILKNANHYRDRAQQVSELEGAIASHLPEPLAARLCALLKASEPNIYKDQLRAAARLLQAHAPADIALIERLCEQPRLSATRLREWLQAHAAQPERLSEQSAEHSDSAPGANASASANSDALAGYARIGADNREACNELH